MLLIKLKIKLNIIKMLKHQQNIFFENRVNSLLIDQLAEIAC